MSDGDFYRHDHRLIFRAIFTLAERNSPFDVVTPSEQLDKEGQPEPGRWSGYLGELAKNTPRWPTSRPMRRSSCERATLRQLIGISNEIADMAYAPQGKSAGSARRGRATDLPDCQRGPKATAQVGINEILVKTIDRIDELFNTNEGLTGISTGFTDLDGMTSGLQPADLVIVAGRPSMGKTTFAMNLVENAVLRSDKVILVFSWKCPPTRS